mmetsp:Transcript_21933/g.36266  ORF Transcript_21933/g.36266 Transcript_21933/m.36266 type:complete len:84 (+) Transcript_21933:99-350(+)|eukprot:CAMPEP_0119017002 /NCGR_PEP_ID=MMETSP1176-20130426/15028_1 /TAXON_ID=265551 /ORGANISM="Synedropsis recta cf, Strain CCMP1620" /LENGTH=83 /DNA_ID=CAMNT_0006970591 /DNA_START=72 /DNA_END=323 /DNA_ORIENTATION=+
MVPWAKRTGYREEAYDATLSTQLRGRMREVAWRKHVDTCKAPADDDYVSPMILNNAITIKAQEEQRQNPYPPTSQRMMNTTFV